MVENNDINIDNKDELDYKNGYIAMISAIEEQFKPLQLAAEMGISVAWFYNCLETIIQKGEESCCRLIEREAASS